VKRLLAFLILMLCVSLFADTLASWPLTANGVATDVLANVNAGVFAGGSGISAVTYGANGAWSDHWGSTTIDTNCYFDISIAPAGQYRLHITDLNFSERRSSTGIREYVVRSSLDNFSTYTGLADVTVPDNPDTRVGSLTGLTLTVEPGQTLHFRWYGFLTEASAGTWRIAASTLSVLGTIEPVTGGSVVADFSAAPTAGSAPLIVIFTNLTAAGTPPYTYDWNFGDNTAHSSATAPQHSYAAAGTYTVTLTASDAASTSDSEVKTGYITVTTSGGSYYDPVAGLTGQALFNGLHSLIDTNTNSSYDDSRLFMYGTLDNENNTVRCVYTGYDFTVPAGQMPADNNINCEHTYAQSWFGTSQTNIKKADVYHLYPVTATVNSSRGNLPFDIVANQTTSYPSYNGYVSKRGTNASGTTVFEPADQHKGDCARALMYFAVRYNMGLSQGGVDMLPSLINWNTQDPVSQTEIDRNEAIHDYQGNRNPFIDHPEYVSYIWGGATLYTSLGFSPGSAEVIEDDGDVTIHVTISNPSATAATVATLHLADGNADDVGGFIPVPLTFPAGSTTTQSVTVNITEDAILEGAEILTFSLMDVSGGNGAANSVIPYYTLTIQDNDMPTPVAYSATGVSTTGFTANWSTETGIAEYELDISSDAAFATYLTGYEALRVTGVSNTVTGLIGGHAYYYRVRAVINDNPGPNSNVITVSTTSNGSGPASDLIISEYLEGSSNNKALELYNGTGSPADLSQYSLKKQVNGAGDLTNEQTLSGSLDDGDCYVIAHSSADPAILAVADLAIATGIISFNGNDAIALYHSGTLIDIVGVLNQVELWGAETTLVRKSSVMNSNPTYTTEEWDSYPQNTFTYLGNHTMDNPVAYTPTNLLIAISGSDVVLNWTPGTRTTYFKIYRSTIPYATDWGTSIATVTTSTWTDAGAASSTKYFYRVTASTTP
jgi:PKD repeat protein